MKTSRLIVCAVAVLAAISSLQAQQPVRPLQDLVGIRARDGQTRMKQRGYDFVRAQRSGSSLYNYFRDNQSGRCISVNISHGRYRSVSYAPYAECGETPGNNQGDVQDLVGAREEDGTNQMAERGYRLVRSNRLYARGGQCLQVEITNGYYRTITQLPVSVCNNYGNSSQIGQGNYSGAQGMNYGMPSGEACFYKDANFRGGKFCVRSGERMAVVPSGFNDRISSVQFKGNVSVVVYRDSNFSGRSLRLQQQVSNLKNYEDWNDSVSSIEVY